MSATWTPTAPTGGAGEIFGRGVVFFLTTVFLWRTFFGLTCTLVFGFTVAAGVDEEAGATGGW